MAIQSKFLGSVTVTGDDAKSFQRKLAHGRGTKAAAASAAAGRQMVATFAKKGAVTFKLQATPTATVTKTVQAKRTTSAKAAGRTSAKS